MTTPRKRLILILGDQLDENASALADFDPAQDAVWMAEVLEESTHIPSSKQRTTVFLSAMRHFAAYLQTRGWPLIYSQLDDPHNTGTLAGELGKAIAQVQPQLLVMTAPGDWRVLQSLRTVAQLHNLSLEIKDDTHFFSTVREFAAHAKDRKQLRLEYFYRELRQRNGILMEGKKPIGGQWNFDADNRESFGKDGPQNVPKRFGFKPSKITREVIEMVQAHYPEHPGSLASFDWPLTREEALEALDDFIAHRLPQFGLGVHHDGAVPCDRLLDRCTRDEQKAHPVGPRLHRHLVARADAVGTQDQVQRIEAVGHADAVLDLAIGGELALEGVELGAVQIPARGQHALHVVGAAAHADADRGGHLGAGRQLFFGGRLFERLRFHFSTAEIARHQSVAGDDGLGSELPRHAAPHRGDGDHHGVHSLAAQRGDLFPSVHQLP